MATQVLNLAGLGNEGWRGAVPVDPALIADGASAYLRRIRRIGNSIQIRLSATPDGGPGDPGPEFSDAFETADGAFTFAAGGQSLTLKGPAHADNTYPSATEPYVWTPDNSDRMQAWFDAVSGDFVLTLDDGTPTVSVRGAAAAGGAEARAHLLRLTPAVRTLRGIAAAGPAQGAAWLSIRRARSLRGIAVAGVPAATARVERQLPPALRFARALHDSAPADRLLTALEISHPAVAVPVRVINDTESREIEGNDYVALRFDARLADDVDGQVPQAELAIDNVGRALTQWIEAAHGGVGATVRVMLVLDIDDPPVEWEVTLDVAGMSVGQERVTARLGFDPLLGRAAVALRHDPQTSLGLF